MKLVDFSALSDLLEGEHNGPARPDPRQLRRLRKSRVRRVRPRKRRKTADASHAETDTRQLRNNVLVTAVCPHHIKEYAKYRGIDDAVNALSCLDVAVMVSGEHLKIRRLAYRFCAKFAQHLAVLPAALYPATT